MKPTVFHLKKLNIKTEVFDLRNESGVFEAKARNRDSGIFDTKTQSPKSGISEAITRKQESDIFEAIAQNQDPGIFEAITQKQESGIFDTKTQSSISPQQPPLDLLPWQMDKIDAAAKLLSQGKTVAFPTETVYGLGANALDAAAVLNIFEAKGRPSDNPLIVHIAHRQALSDLVEDIPQQAYRLMDVFWPGSLSIILKRKSCLPHIVTAGLETVAIRMPANPEARFLIEKAGCPVAAPSANLSGKPSPTRPEHVLKDLTGRVDGILLGRNCDVGLESTVIDMTVTPPVILRPGIVTKQEIESVIGPVQQPELKQAVPLPSEPIQSGGESEPDRLSTINLEIERINSNRYSPLQSAPKAPGMKYTHYAPNAPLVLYEGPVQSQSSEIRTRAERELGSGKKVGIIASEETRLDYKALQNQLRNNTALLIHSAGTRKDLKTVANELFDILRTFDNENVDIILSESFEASGVGSAVMNRMEKAAKDIIQV